MTSPRDNHEMIEATQIGAEQGAEPMKITRAQLMMVIRQRVEELTNEIEAALKDLGFTGPVGRQVVLTGGGAELKNIADYMQGVLGRAVRVGRPKQLTGLPDAHSGPAFSTLVGLALLAASRPRRHSRHRPPIARASRGQGHDRPADRRDEGRVLAPLRTAGLKRVRGRRLMATTWHRNRASAAGADPAARRGGIPQLRRPRRDRHRCSADEGRSRPSARSLRPRLIGLLLDLRPGAAVRRLAVRSLLRLSHDGARASCCGRPALC